MTVTQGSTNDRMGVTSGGVRYVTSYRRPLLHDLIECPFCLGFWAAAVVYVAWIYFPTGTLYAAFPFALSGAVGLIAKHWDP